MVTMSIVPYEAPTVDLATLTLDELRDAAIAENDAVNGFTAGALMHTIRLGEILNVVHDRLDAEGKPWLKWLEAAGITQSAASRSTRLAKYRSSLPAEAFEVRQGVNGRLIDPSINNALLYIADLPKLHPPKRFPEDIQAEARRLRNTGMVYKEIGELLGVSTSALYRWCDPEHEKRVKASQKRSYRNRDKALARRAKQDDERRKLAKVTGGELSLAYAEIRKAVAACDRHATNADAVTYGPVRKAITLLHQAENCIVDAMKAAYSESAA